ncbi:hypothetical protein M673_19670 (plasmid) [Aureimonas sp. AU20]|nr:hypothetical protein M673_19670 [Aureimonas sp. AU20]
MTRAAKTAVPVMSAAERTGGGRPPGFGAEADVFWSLSGRRLLPRGAMRFRKFASLEDAVRFVVLDKGEPRFQCVIDTDTARYEGREIEDLYGRPDFPAEPIAPKPQARRFCQGLWGPKRLPRYAADRDDVGTWTVSLIATRQAVSIRDVSMTRMSRGEAERMTRVLNSADEQDMLVMGP